MLYRVCFFCLLAVQYSVQQRLEFKFTAEQKQNMVHAHNTLRRAQGASNMEELVRNITYCSRNLKQYFPLFYVEQKIWA